MDLQLPAALEIRERNIKREGGSRAQDAVAVLLHRNILHVRDVHSSDEQEEAYGWCF